MISVMIYTLRTGMVYGAVRGTQRCYVSSLARFKTFYSPTEVQELKKQGRVRVIEVGQDSQAQAQYDSQHIPGAQFFNVDSSSDKHASAKFMLPSADVFSKYVQGLGVGNDSHVILYERCPLGLMWSPRVWWMFRVFGHDTVSFITGGLDAWTQNELEVGDTCLMHRTFDKINCMISTDMVKTLQFFKKIENRTILTACLKKQKQILKF